MVGIERRAGVARKERGVKWAGGEIRADEVGVTRVLVVEEDIRVFLKAALPG